MQQDSSAMTLLSRMRPGEQGIVQAYERTLSFHVRLKELGLIRGASVRVERLSPLGDPMEICVRGSRLSVRKKDADFILIRKEKV